MRCFPTFEFENRLKKLRKNITENDVFLITIFKQTIQPLLF